MIRKLFTATVIGLASFIIVGFVTFILLQILLAFILLLALGIISSPIFAAIALIGWIIVKVLS